MKRTLAIAATLLLAACLAGAADEPKGKGNEKSVSGKIVRLDMNEKSVTIEDAKPQTLTIWWNDSTRVMGGEMKEGETVKVGYVESENKMWATWIRIEAPGR